MLCLHRSIAISSVAPCYMCNLYVVCYDTATLFMGCYVLDLGVRRGLQDRWGVLFAPLSHSLILMTLGGEFAGFTECRKQFLDFKSISAGIFPYREWASFVSYLAFSTLAHKSRLMLGGAIPDSKYNSSTFVGLRHPLLARYALLSCESSL